MQRSPTRRGGLLGHLTLFLRRCCQSCDPAEPDQGDGQQLVVFCLVSADFSFMYMQGLVLEAQRKSMRPLGERRKSCGDRRGRTRCSAGHHTGELWITTPMVSDLNEVETSSLSRSNWAPGSPPSWQKCRLPTTVRVSRARRRASAVGHQVVGHVPCVARTALRS